jgi:AbrB family looped-hinge helix DNA binding protein
MATVTVSEKGQVVIPAAIRRSLGIKPGTQLEFEREGDTIRVTVEGAVPPSRIDEGYGLLKATRIRGQRRLSDFDPAAAMKKTARR